MTFQKIKNSSFMTLWTFGGSSLSLSDWSPNFPLCFKLSTPLRNTKFDELFSPLPSFNLFRNWLISSSQTPTSQVVQSNCYSFTSSLLIPEHEPIQVSCSASVSAFSGLPILVRIIITPTSAPVRMKKLDFITFGLDSPPRKRRYTKRTQMVEDTQNHEKERKKRRKIEQIHPSKEENEWNSLKLSSLHQVEVTKTQKKEDENTFPIFPVLSCEVTETSKPSINEEGHRISNMCSIAAILNY